MGIADLGGHLSDLKRARLQQALGRLQAALTHKAVSRQRALAFQKALKLGWAKADLCCEPGQGWRRGKVGVDLGDKPVEAMLNGTVCGPHLSVAARGLQRQGQDLIAARFQSQRR